MCMPSGLRGRRPLTTFIRVTRGSSGNPPRKTAGGAHDEVQHSAGPRIAGQRQQHRSRQPAHLQLIHIRCRIGQRHAPLGLCAQRQPDPRLSGKADRPAGARDSRLRFRVRTRRDSRGAVHLQTRGPHRGRQEHLRRHVFAVQRVLRRARAGVRQRRHRRLRGARRRDQRVRQRRPRGQRRILRDADQPAAADQQRQPHLGHRAPIRRAVHRRQHVRHPVPAAAARFGRGYRHPFGHQIPGRPFRGERRPCGGVGR